MRRERKEGRAACTGRAEAGGKREGTHESALSHQRDLTASGQTSQVGIISHFF